MVAQASGSSGQLVFGVVAVLELRRVDLRGVEIPEWR
jgi:hypothetical protein